MIKTLDIDIETYSDVDLTKTNVYVYSESPNFEVTLFGYSLNDGPVECIDLTKEKLPQWLADMLTDPAVLKRAYNANFERVCLSRYLGMEGFLPPEQWHCDRVQALMMGLPSSLKDCGAALELDKQKMEEGKELIQYFCKPCKPTKANGGRTRNYPSQAPEKWELFKRYNIRDVETEQEIRRRTEDYYIPQEEWKAYWMDQRINDRGVRIDRVLVDNAVKISEAHTGRLTEEAQGLTGLDNVNSVSQLKGWLGVEGSLNKETVQNLRQEDIEPEKDRVLEIRQELGKTSVSKYQAMQRGRNSDERVRGLFAFYGAGRTGRWAGRQVQVQNLPQNHLEDLDTARKVVKDGDREGLEMLFGNVPATLSELIRTAFIPRDGYTFAVADFSAIEARVVAWMTGETWRQELFKNGGDIYCASASKMFGVPVEKHGINGHLRQKGKIAELALGYGGSVGAMTAMGALKMGLKEEELPDIVSAWREANPHVVDFWWRIGDTAMDVVRRGLESWTSELPHGLAMRMQGNALCIRLPSGRALRYWAPEIGRNKFGSESLTYGGTESGAWGRVETYGPKLFENIVQGTARDCLREAMMRVQGRYPEIVMHIHDEMVVEVPKEEAREALSFMLECMKTPIVWAKGLILKGDGYLTDYYKKD